MRSSYEPCSSSLDYYKVTERLGTRVVVGRYVQPSLLLFFFFFENKSHENMKEIADCIYICMYVILYLIDQKNRAEAG